MQHLASKASASVIRPTLFLASLCYPFVALSPLEPKLKGEKLELWQMLCAQAAVEQDADKLMELVKEIDRLLGEKQDRLDRERAAKGKNKS